MSTEEIQRIRQVYAEYKRSGKWAAAYGPGKQRMCQERDDALRGLIRRGFTRPLSECRILDIGCGNGSLLNWFQAEGADPRNLVGIDLLPSQIEDARSKYPGLVFLEANAEHLEFPDASFDVVLVFTVFSSILDHSMARNVAQTVARILKRDGAIVWYDIRYPNPRNRNVRAMTKARIGRLFPEFVLDLKSITVLPPLAYRLGRFAREIYPLLAMVPVLRSNYLGLLRSCRAGGDGGLEP